MANGTARASELFRRRKAASLRLGLGEIEGGEAAVVIASVRPAFDLLFLAIRNERQQDIPSLSSRLRTTNY